MRKIFFKVADSWKGFWGSLCMKITVIFEWPPKKKYFKKIDEKDFWDRSECSLFYIKKIDLPTPPFLWCQTCHPDNLQWDKENPSNSTKKSPIYLLPTNTRKAFSIQYRYKLKRKKLDEFFLKNSASMLLIWFMIYRYSHTY